MHVLDNSRQRHAKENKNIKSTKENPKVTIQPVSKVMLTDKSVKETARSFQKWGSQLGHWTVL